MLSYGIMMYVQSQTVNREKKNIDMCEMIYTHTTLLIYFDAFPVLQIMKYLWGEKNRIIKFDA